MILVTGATGFIGRQLITRLMTQDVRLRVLLTRQEQRRLPWDVDDANAPEIVTGTAMDEESLFAAVSGVHVIIHLQSAQWWGRPRQLERVDIVGTRNLIAAARSARVGRIIYLSHLGAAPSSAFNLLSIKGQAEAQVRNSGLAYTIIRVGLVFGPEDAFINHIAMLLSVNPIFFLMPGQGEIILHPLYIDDLLEAMNRSLGDLQTVDRVIEIGGPEYVRLDDLLATVMRITGMYRYVIPVPPYTLRLLTRLYGFVFRRTLMTPQWLDYLAANRTAPLGNTYTTFNFQPRRFEDTLVTYLPRRWYTLRALRYVFKRRPRSI